MLMLSDLRYLCVILLKLEIKNLNCYQIIISKGKFYFGVFYPNFFLVRNFALIFQGFFRQRSLRVNAIPTRNANEKENKKYLLSTKALKKQGFIRGKNKAKVNSFHRSRYASQIPLSTYNQSTEVLKCGSLV